MDYVGSKANKCDNGSVGTPRTQVNSPRRLLARESMATGLVQRRFLQPQHVWQWKREATDDSIRNDKRRAERLSRPSTSERPVRGVDAPIPCTPPRRKTSNADQNNELILKHHGNGLVIPEEEGGSPRPTSKSSYRYYCNHELTETVKIMKFSELNTFLRENEKKKGEDRCNVRISFHDFPYIKIKLQKYENNGNGYALPLCKKESITEINSTVFDTGDIPVKKRNLVAPSQRISLDVVKAIQMSKLPPTVETQTSRQNSILPNDYFPARNDVRRDSNTSSKSSKHGQTNKRVHFEQKWIFDDGKYYFSDNPHRCK